MKLKKTMALWRILVVVYDDGYFVSYEWLVSFEDIDESLKFREKIYMHTILWPQITRELCLYA